MSNATYKEYLADAEWQALRGEVLQRADHRCEECKQPWGLQVHHRTYARLGNESLDDLVCLYRDCHRKAHGIAPPITGGFTMEQQSNFDIEAFKKEAEALKIEGAKLNEILLNSPPDKDTPEWTALVESAAALSHRQAEIFATVLEHFRKIFG